MPMFWRAARSADLPRPVSSVPATYTTPWSGRSSRLIRRSSVDLPAPLLPMMPKVSPARIDSDTSQTASKRPAGRRKDLLTASSRITGWGTAESGESVALWVIG